jgi:hypothetical protein
MPISEGISGPHLSAAFLCEKVLVERDNVQSFIRVVERFTVPKVTVPPGIQFPPGAISPAVIQFNIVIVLKAGDLHIGKYALKIVLIKPDGSESSSNDIDAFFSGSDENGVALISPIAIPTPEEGLHWFDVYFEGRLITRIPLRVLYQQVQMSPFQPM